MAIYHEYAQVYDASGQLAFSLKMIPYLQQLLDRHPVQGRTMLDLACGTGTVAIGFAQAGWRVYGVDGSPQMLNQARAKAAEFETTVHWSCQDMRRFVLPEPVHLATCLYDSMNYMLTSEDLSAVFRRVYNALAPGGLWILDMNTAYALATVWDDATYFSDSPDLSMVMKSRYDARHQRCTVTVTCFQRVNDLYRKIVEQHTEQAYPPEQVSTCLVDAGFVLEGSYDCFGFERPRAATQRILWVARRPAR
jgi:ubiquinone/menaquinone biosynthesis C-methylase UbiE